MNIELSRLREFNLQVNGDVGRIYISARIRVMGGSPTYRRLSAATLERFSLSCLPLGLNFRGLVVTSHEPADAGDGLFADFTLEGPAS